MKYCH